MQTHTVYNFDLLYNEFKKTNFCKPLYTYHDLSSKEIIRQRLFETRDEISQLNQVHSNLTPESIAQSMVLEYLVFMRKVVPLIEWEYRWGHPRPRDYSIDKFENLKGPLNQLLLGMKNSDWENLPCVLIYDLCALLWAFAAYRDLDLVISISNIMFEILHLIQQLGLNDNNPIGEAVQASMGVSLHRIHTWKKWSCSVYRARATAHHVVGDYHNALIFYNKIVKTDSEYTMTLEAASQICKINPSAENVYSARCAFVNSVVGRTINWTDEAQVQYLMSMYDFYKHALQLKLPETYP